MNKETEKAGEPNGCVRVEATVRRLLKEMIDAAESHPCFLGWQNEITMEEANDEGGDAAFVTLDIAWKAKEALELLDVQRPELKEEP